MMPDLDGYSLGALLFLAASALTAGLARGFSGFGAALIFIPLASTVVDTTVAAPMLLVVDIVMASPLLPRAWPIADKREIATMLIGTVIGVPIGAYVLTRSDPVAIRWMIAAMVFPLLGLLMAGWRYHCKPSRPLASGVGLVAGFFSGVAQVGGPPVVIYWLGGANKPEQVRANIVLYFAASAALTCAAYLIAGILKTKIIGLALVIGPVYGLGLWLGSHSFGLAGEATFRRICYALIAAAGIISLPVLDGIIR